MKGLLARGRIAGIHARKGAEHRRLHNIDRQARAVLLNAGISRVAARTGVGLGVGRMVKGHNRHFKLLGALTAKVDGVARQRRGSCLDTNSRKTQRHGKHCTGGHKPHGASRNEGCTTYGSH